MVKEGLGFEIIELRLGFLVDNNGERLVSGLKKIKRVFLEMMILLLLDIDGVNSVVLFVDIVIGEVEDDFVLKDKS